MDDISKIQLPSGVTYSIKDASAIASVTKSGDTITVTTRGGVSTTFSGADTKLGIVSTSSKTYLTGVTTAPTATNLDLSGVANVSVYATNGQLNGYTVRIAEKVKLQYNATTQSLDFIFE